MIRVALIGTGGIALANHVPGVALCPDASIVAQIQQLERGASV